MYQQQISTPTATPTSRTTTILTVAPSLIKGKQRGAEKEYHDLPTRIT